MTSSSASTHSCTVQDLLYNANIGIHDDVFDACYYQKQRRASNPRVAMWLIQFATSVQSLLNLLFTINKNQQFPQSNKQDDKSLKLNI